MEHEQLSFVDAIKTLGRKFHIVIEEKEPSPEEMAQQNERESMMLVTEYAAKYFTKTLFETDEGQSVGLGYFKHRGISDETIRKFQLGYSPEQRDALTKQAQEHGYKLQYLEKTGLSIVRDDYKGDRFRGRVIFPIHSLSGKVIAFGGRILKSDAKAAKYLNSPESEIYHKSRVLYGLYHARQEIVKQDRCYLVEGYTDVLSFHQAGITNVVASSGTALTVEQIRLIARFSPNVTIIYDGDTAGIKASIRGIDLLLEEGMNIKVLLLPDGEDPDSFAKKLGKEKLNSYIAEHETDFIKFKTSLLLEGTENDPVKQAQLIQDIVRTISVIPDPILISVYVKECSKLLNVEEPVIYTEIRKLKSKKSGKNAIRSTQTEATTASAAQSISSKPLPNLSTNPLETEEREVLRYLIKYGNEKLGYVIIDDKEIEMSVGEYIIHSLKEDELRSTNPLHDQILNEYEKNISTPGFLPHRYFVSHPNPLISSLTTDLIAREYQLSRIHSKYGPIKKDEELLDVLVPRILTELKWKLVKIKIDKVMMELKEEQEKGNLERQIELIKEMTTLQNVFKYISQQHGERTII